MIGNEGKHFCVGANIFAIAVAAQQGEFDVIDAAIRKMQGLLQSIRFAAKPVVVAPFGMTLGGGCELVMAAPRVVASAETYIGLVEVGVGLIPAGTGSKEIARRVISAGMRGAERASRWPALQQAFEQVGLAKVATSAAEARQMRILAERDRIVDESGSPAGGGQTRSRWRWSEAGYRPPIGRARLRRRAGRLRRAPGGAVPDAGGTLRLRARRPDRRASSATCCAVAT